MNLKAFAITLPLAGALVATTGWAQQTAGDTGQAGTSSKAVKSAQKEKHWNGNLVDVGCMSKTLASGNESSPQAEPAASVPHFTGAEGALPQPGQVPGSGGQGGIGAGPRGQEAGPPTTDSGLSPDQQARVNQESRVDSAAKRCAASQSSQALGLATPDGQVMQFDPEGNRKAKEALKAADVQQGKKVKAKVTGMMEDKTTVKVAEVDVKGRGK